MATKKKKDEEMLVPPVQAENFNDVPELHDTIEESIVTGERNEMTNPVAPATTDLGSGLAGERPAPSRPLQTQTAPATTDLGNGLAMRKPAVDEQPAVNGSLEPQATQEAQPAPAPAQQQEAAQPAEQASRNDAPAETNMSPAQAIEQEAERIGQESLEPKPREIPVKLSPEELVASQRAAADAILREPTNTAEAVAATKGAAALEENKPDAMRESFVNAQEAERQSFADLLQGMRDDYDREREAAQAELKADSRAARFTGYTELGSAIANLIGVAEGNAVSQVYKPVAQDWMKKPDQDMREHRTRIDNLRQRQRDTELKMSQLKSQMNMERMKFDMQREKQRYENELQKARIAYETARTEAARQKAQQDAAKAEMELARIQAQTESYEAQARQRDAAARASLSNAQTKREESRRKGQQQEELNQAKIGETEARTAWQWSRATGQPARAPGWSVQTSEPAPAPRTENAGANGKQGNKKPIGSYFSK